MRRDGDSEVFFRDFYLGELIHENGVINSGVKSRVLEALEGQDSKSLTYKKAQISDLIFIVWHNDTIV